MQAFVNLVLTLCDAGDSVVMFAPYYFNSYMSFQMTGVTNILVGPGDPKTLYPDAGQSVRPFEIPLGNGCRLFVCIFFFSDIQIG